MSEKLRLYYQQPAGRWEETLPVGNGHLGAMIWGGPREELLGLNEESLWSGYERDRNNPGAYDSLAEVRRLIFEGRCTEAERMIQENMLGEHGESYMPLGNLKIEYRNIRPSGEAAGRDGAWAGNKTECDRNDNGVTNYTRSLDLEEAVACVDFDAEGVHYHREVFASYPAKALILLFTASEPVMDLELSLDSMMKCTFSEAEDGLVFRGRCPEHVDPIPINKGEDAVVWGYRGRRFSGRIRMLEGDGVLSAEGERIRLKGASRAVFAVEAVRAALLEDSPYEALKEAHIADYRSIYSGVELYLGNSRKRPRMSGFRN